MAGYLPAVLVFASLRYGLVVTHNPNRRATMTDAMTSLCTVLEKSANSDFLRAMTAYAVQCLGVQYRKPDGRRAWRAIWSASNTAPSTGSGGYRDRLWNTRRDGRSAHPEAAERKLGHDPACQ